ncbi:MAG: fumarylacetoacetate hydrolase family protein [Leptothrix sp. (in: b-proteobacteria)]
MTTAPTSADVAADVTTALATAQRDHTPADNQALAAALTTPEQAYAVQIAVGQALGWWQNEPARHWKSGGARLDSITHAPLPPHGVWASPADASDWPFHRRGIEAEIALRLGQPVDAALAATLNEADAAALIDAMAVSIEVVDSRWQDGSAAAPLLRLADGQSHGALVLGDWIAFDPAHDWSNQTCVAQIGTQAVVERQGSHPLGRPTAVLPAWLRHATQNGQVLPAGTVVTTGTWVGLLDAAAGERVTVEFAGIGAAQLQL